jgi:hypothetical protein
LKAHLKNIIAPICRLKTFRRRTSTELERRHYQLVNDRVVNDITLESLYKPHTLTALGALCAWLMWKALSRFFRFFLKILCELGLLFGVKIIEDKLKINTIN